jgi:Family of unknown function (DUF6064)
LEEILSMSSVLEVYATFNQGAWPLRLFWYGLAVIAVVLVLRSNRLASRFASAFLRAYSIWIGVVFFWILYAPMDQNAWFVGIAFRFPGALLFWAGVVRFDLRFEPTRNAAALFGAVAIAYVLVPYPFTGALEGHPFPGEPIFGISPCAAAIFMVGFLLWSRQRLPTYLRLVPLGWALTAWINMIPMTIWRDAFGLSILAVGGVALLIWRDRTTVRRTLPIALVVAALAFASGHDDVEMSAALILAAITFVPDFVDRCRGETVRRPRPATPTLPA